LIVSFEEIEQVGLTTCVAVSSTDVVVLFGCEGLDVRAGYQVGLEVIMGECFVLVLMVDVEVVDTSVGTKTAHLVTDEVVVHCSQSVNPAHF
jgi:hypothetical protein